MKLGLYDLVKFLLKQHKDFRSEDRKLIWRVWEHQDLVYMGAITEENFLESQPIESITRARRKIQELHPELQASEAVRNHRNRTKKQKGTHIYRERVTQFQPRDFSQPKDLFERE